MNEKLVPSPNLCVLSLLEKPLQGGSQKIEDVNDNANLDHTLIYSNQPIISCQWKDEDITSDFNPSPPLSRSKSLDVGNHDIETKISTLLQQSKKRKTLNNAQGQCNNLESNLEEGFVSRRLHSHHAFKKCNGSRSIDEFEVLNKIDEGAYGIVSRARDKITREIVALKEVKIVKRSDGFPLTSLREINILVSLCHPSIIKLKEVIVKENVIGNILDMRVFLVMDYVEHNLKDFMNGMHQSFSVSEIKCLMLQLLNGVNYLHDNWILHRDLKPSNILLNNCGELKICDFGLARQYGDLPSSYTQDVVTLWYRAPELLLGAETYSTPVDIWSLGCIMAELFTQEPLFPGKSDLDEIDKIFKTLGTPNDKIWPEFTKLWGGKCKFTERSKLRAKFAKTAFLAKPILSPEGFDLMNRMLTYDPQKRITANEALNHNWFLEDPLPMAKERMPTCPPQREPFQRIRIPT